MRVLWYSLGGWFMPSAPANVEVIDLRSSVSNEELSELTSAPSSYFFEPTPHPEINNYDPVQMATRLAQVSARRPRRLVAFTSQPSPTSFDTQCAFAEQTGRILGVSAELQRVAPATRSNGRRVTRIKKVNDPRAGSIDPGPEVNWLRALNAAVRQEVPTEAIPHDVRRFVTLYLFPVRGGLWLSSTQQQILHRLATGEVGVRAESVASDLNIQLVTAQRAIRGIAGFFSESGGRRSPEFVGQIAQKYNWFLRYNEP